MKKGGGDGPRISILTISSGAKIDYQGPLRAGKKTADDRALRSPGGLVAA
jgi:hypothetical protein